MRPYVPARFEVSTEALIQGLYELEFRVLYMRYELERREFEAEKSVLKFLVESFQPIPKPNPHEEEFSSLEH